MKWLFFTMGHTHSGWPASLSIVWAYQPAVWFRTYLSEVLRELSRTQQTVAQWLVRDQCQSWTSPSKESNPKFLKFHSHSIHFSHLLFKTLTLWYDEREHFFYFFADIRIQREENQIDSILILERMAEDSQCFTNLFHLFVHCCVVLGLEKREMLQKIFGDGPLTVPHTTVVKSSQGEAGQWDW